MTGYCKWCDTLTDDIVQDFNSETNALVWSGCLSCKMKQLERKRKSRGRIAVIKDIFKRKSEKPTHEELRDRHPERFF